MQILYKKFEIYTSLSDEINLLVESFNKDEKIDIGQIDNLCRLFIEYQNSLSKIYPNIELSNYKMEKFVANDTVGFLIIFQLKFLLKFKIYLFINFIGNRRSTLLS